MIFTGLRSKVLSTVDEEKAEITEESSFCPLNSIFSMLQTKLIDQDQWIFLNTLHDHTTHEGIDGFSSH